MTRTSLPAPSSSRLASLGLLVLAFAPGSVQAQGTVIGWGQNFYGQTSPPPGGGGDAVEFSGGDGHSIARRSDGSLVSWGSNSHDLVTQTPSGNDFVDVSAGFYHSLAVRSDGSLECWGWDGFGQVSGTPTESNFQKVDCGIYYSLALRHDGTIAAWGANTNGEVSDVPTEAGFVQISAGDSHAHALRADGSIVSWGTDSGPYDYGQVTRTPPGTGFVQVAAGGRFSFALHSDGTLISWGYDGFGSVSNTPSGNDFVEIAAGAYHSMALRADGTLEVWGIEVALEGIGYGQVTNAPTGDGYTVIGTGQQHAFAVLGSFGSTSCYGDGTGAPCPCGNNAAIADRGCVHSGGTGMGIHGLGTASVTADVLRVVASNCPPGNAGIFYAGKTSLGAGNALYDGLQCAGGDVRRFHGRFQSSGTVSDTGFVAQSADAYFAAGETVHFQYWTRDVAAGASPCGTFANFSPLYSVTFAP